MDNIQVIERAFRLLELTAESPGPHTLGELAERSNLKPPTAARIIHTLTSLGYLEQLGRKTGYVLGGMAFELVRDRNCRSPLVRASEHPLEEYSAATGEYVCLSVMRDGKRVILRSIQSTNPIQIHAARIVREETPYRSQSGRLLLAVLPESEQRKFYRLHGQPGELWPEADTEERFLSTLAGIRRAGELTCITADLASLALPVVLNNHVIAAVGTFVPAYRFTGEHETTVRKELVRLSRSIAGEMIT